jgi:KDO2-lipid IV(A) lauroyltransferase
VVVESIKTITISKAEMRKRVVLNNAHLLRQYYDEGQGVIVLAGHQANWEWCLVGFDAAVEMKIDGVYRPLHNQFFDALMIKIRGRFGANPLKADDTSSHLKRNKLEARILALVADQTPSPKGASVVQFLEQPTAFFRGPELMATISGWPVLYAEMVRLTRGKYQINFYSVLEVGDNVRLIIPRYAELLEASIKRNPEQWLWSHRRWKHIVSLPSRT